MNSYELFIGLRYTRSRQRTRFISVISLISIVGIALGMTVLITVLSVFNGFQREVRTRMLSAVAHIQVSDINERLSLQLNANNLFDREYYTRVRNNGWSTPGDTRSVVLSAAYRF